jgi:bifunctional DNA-binding transcriptional regulator/antitoxin component of YhaV-PrlF toxin-antitoxin module
VRFSAVLSDSGRGGGRWIEIPFDAKDEFGEARAAVAGTVNGAGFRSRLSVYGGKTYLGLRKEIRDAAGIDVGDEVDVVIERDDAPREVELPPALAAALEGDAEAQGAYESLSFTHRKEYARWIAEARKDETRERRVVKALEMLRAGTKTPG